MRFINVVGLFPGRLDYMVSEAKRLQKESGLNEVALCLTLHPEGFPAIEKPIFYVKLFREYKKALEGTGIHVGILLQSLIGHGWAGSSGLAGKMAADTQYSRQSGPLVPA